VLPRRDDPGETDFEINRVDNQAATQAGNQLATPAATPSPDNSEYVRSIGGVPIQEAAEPLEHMTETYDPDQEDDGDVATENLRE
jgi:hypothetical protein